MYGSQVIIIREIQTQDLVALEEWARDKQLHKLEWSRSYRPLNGCRRYFNAPRHNQVPFSLVTERNLVLKSRISLRG